MRIMLGKIKAKDYFNYLCENFMRLGKEESGKERNHFWLLFFFSVDFGSPDPGIFLILKYIENYTQTGSLVFSKYNELTFPEMCKGSCLCKWAKGTSHMELI